MYLHVYYLLVMENVLKFRTLFFFFFHFFFFFCLKFCFLCSCFIKCLVEFANRVDVDQTTPEEQSDMGLHCLQILL